MFSAAMQRSVPVSLLRLLHFATSTFSTFSTSSTFAARPVFSHLGNPLHVDRRALALLFGGQGFEQLDRVNEVVLDRLPRGLEVDAADLGNRRLRIWRTLLQ